MAPDTFINPIIQKQKVDAVVSRTVRKPTDLYNGLTIHSITILVACGQVRLLKLLLKESPSHSGLERSTPLGTPLYAAAWPGNLRAAGILLGVWGRCE